jgi:carotenoid cleavage dioxygenase-like enzyme
LAYDCFSGEVPAWLKGSLFSSSPGIFDLENASVNNWFDGYAILNQFVVNGNKVSFKSRYLKSKAYEKALEAKRPIMPEFGTPPWTNNRTFFSKLLPFVIKTNIAFCILIEMDFIFIGSLRLYGQCGRDRI